MEAVHISVPAQMVRKARDWLIDHDPDPAGYAVVALAEDGDVQIVSMQRFDVDGQPDFTPEHLICLQDGLVLHKSSSTQAREPSEQLMAGSRHDVTANSLDRRFRGRVVISEAEFEWLSSAYAYGAASTVPGVTSALRVLKERVIRGERIWLFEPGAMYQLEVRRLPDFQEWVRRHFPNIGPI